MSTKTFPYRVADLSPGRRAWINALHLSGPTVWMVGLLEADVTGAQSYIVEHRARTGESLSFTGFLIHCLARAVDENRDVQTYLKGRRHIAIFDNVHVGMMVEHDDGKTRALMGHVVVDANRKTYREIHNEIRRTQSEPVPANRGMPNWLRSALLLPWPLSKLFKAFMAFASRRDPAMRVSSAGTVSITAVGMFGKGHSGWGITATPVSCALVVGSIATKPAVVDGDIVPRDILNLTVMLDHDVVDGAPAARFISRLVELIESGDGLDEADES
jgi:pyruvate/2-oxoglutarate dehydrogenase complex dihydrolipoamide acyltransferase (E2) component